MLKSNKIYVMLCYDISFQASRTSNFETDNDNLGPGLERTAGDISARTCTIANIRIGICILKL